MTDAAVTIWTDEKGNLLVQREDGAYAAGLRGTDVVWQACPIPLAKEGDNAMALLGKALGW